VIKRVGEIDENAVSLGGVSAMQNFVFKRYAVSVVLLALQMIRRFPAGSTGHFQITKG
jgi:hypothetical protein